MQFELIYRPKQDTVKNEVEIECYFNRRYRYVGTGIYIEKQYWNESKQIVSKSHPQAATVNKLLRDKITNLEDECFRYEHNGGTFDFNALKSVTGRKSKQNFCDYILSELKKETKLDLKTFVKYRANVEIIRSCIGEVGADRVTRSEVEKLDKFFRDKYAQSTVARLHIFVKKYINLACKNKLLKSNPYDELDIDLFRGESSKTYLTMAEIEAIENIKDLPPSIELVRDRFLYSCYTGLRISDNLAFRKVLVYDTADGYVVSLHTIKGYGHDLIHPVGLMFNGKPDKILRRWMNSHDGETVFPATSASYIYEALKVVKEMAGIEKPMNFHVSRHTCATQLANITLNPFLLMNIMGWSDVKTAMGYIHSSPENTKKQLRMIGESWITKTI